MVISDRLKAQYLTIFPLKLHFRDVQEFCRAAARFRRGVSIRREHRLLQQLPVFWHRLQRLLRRLLPQWAPEEGQLKKKSQCVKTVYSWHLCSFCYFFLAFGFCFCFFCFQKNSPFFSLLQTFPDGRILIRCVRHPMKRRRRGLSSINN